MKINYISSIIYIILIFINCDNPALADDSGNDYVSIELISDRELIQPGKPFRIGILMTMEEKWHTYWKNPGNTGMPTIIQFNSPDGFNCTDFKWPQPFKFKDGDLINYGYKDTVLFISYVYPLKSLEIGEKYSFDAKLSWLVCKEKCLPGSDSVSIQIAVSENNKINENNRVLFDRFEDLLPLETDSWTFSAQMKDEVIILNANKYLTFEIDMEEVEFYPINEATIDLTAEQKYIPSQYEFDLVLTLDKFRYEDPKRLSGILVSPGGWVDGRKSKAILVNNIRVK